MPRASSKFTQADVARALKGAMAAGWPVGSVEITATGTIRIAAPREAASTEPSAFDAWKDKRGAGEAKRRP